MLRENKVLPMMFSAVLLFTSAVCWKTHRQRKQLEMSGCQLETLQDHYSLLNHWLEIKNEGKSTASYFEEMGYHHIAIYGMAELGNRLMEDLTGSTVCVDYGIDRDVCCSIGRIDEVYFPEDELPKTEAIVVTPYSAFGAIKKLLETKVNCPILSLEDVVWSV